MQITVLESISPIKIKKKVSKKTKSYIEKLQNSKQLEVSKKIYLHSVPQLEDFSIVNHVGKNLTDLEIFKNPELQAILQKTPNCNLLSNKVLTIQDNIHLMNLFNCCLELDSLEKIDLGIFKLVQGKENIIDFASKYPTEQLQAIFIPLKNSQSEFIAWVKENWNQISSYEEPTFSTKYIPKDVLILTEILQLLTTNKTYSEIANILLLKYPDDDRLKDESQIRVMVSRFKEYLVNGLTDASIMNSLERNSK